MPNINLLVEHLRVLGFGYPLSVTADYQWILVQRFLLPPGFNWPEMELLVQIPCDYPVSPPGVGSGVYVPVGLLFCGRPLRDVHSSRGPGWGNWAWLCYRHIQWDPHRDNLVRFVEMVRSDLTNPPT